MLQAVLLFVLLNPHMASKLKLTKSLLLGLLGALLGGGVAFAVLNFAPRIAGTLIGAVAGAGLGLAVAAFVIRQDLSNLRQL